MTAQSLDWDWIIIGAGAAGLFAAARSAGQKVLVLERGPKAGRKVLISGGGQCNFTHAENLSAMVTHYGDKKNFVRHAIGKLDSEDLIRYFEDLGMASVKRPDGKVFPASLRAADLVEALTQTAKDLGVTFSFGQTVDSVELEDNGGFKVTCGDRTYLSRKVLLACGGSSYPMTGSDGSGAGLAETLGLKVVTPRPALAPVYHQDPLLHRLAGVVIVNADFCYRDNTGRRTLKGDLLLTHTGISGPGILDSARWMKAGGILELRLSDLDGASLEAALLDQASKHGTRQLKTVLRGFVKTKSLSEMIETQLGDAACETPMASLSKSLRQQVIRLVTAYEVKITQIGALRSAMATAGGVATTEVVARTMMAKRIPGLYFAGEILDVDGDTGGYNLHWAFASGALAMAAGTQGTDA